MRSMVEGALRLPKGGLPRSEPGFDKLSPGGSISHSFPRHCIATREALARALTPV
jgi:hypothetical protein